MKAKKIWINNKSIFVETTDSKIASMPLSWFKRLQNASEKDLLEYELWNENSWIHWEKLGEDLSVEGFFTYRKELETSK